MAQGTAEGISPERMKLARGKRQLSQDALARLCKVRVGTIARIEQGRGPEISNILVQRIMAALGVSAFYLVGKRDDPRPAVYLTDEEESLLLMFRNLSPAARKLFMVANKAALTDGEQQMMDTYRAMDNAQRELLLEAATRQMYLMRKIRGGGATPENYVVTRNLKSHLSGAFPVY